MGVTIDFIWLINFKQSLDVIGLRLALELGVLRGQELRCAHVNVSRNFSISIKL